jgi:putative ABC transport system permease protein
MSAVGAPVRSDDPPAMTLVGWIARLVPASRRREWLEEWRGELFHAREQARAAGEPEARIRWRLRLRGAGALWDALWLRRVWGEAPQHGWSFREATRVLRRQPGFTLMVVGTLGLGIGAATAVFSVVDGLLLRPIPFRDPERLVMLSGGRGAYAGVEQARVWGAQKGVFETLLAFSQRGVMLTRPGEPRSLRAQLMQPGALRALGVAPTLGREFVAGETVPGRDRIVMLSDEEWRTGFAGDPAVVGGTVFLNDEPYTIVGVMPPTVRRLPGGIPRIALPLPDTMLRTLMLLGRLRADVSLQTAQDRLDVVTTRLDGMQPRDGGWSVRLKGLERSLEQTTRNGLVALAGAVLLLLLVACVNAAGLLFVRGMARRPELAIRRALGASRALLFRQSLVESLVLALLSGAAGVALAWWGVRALVGLAPDGLIRFSYNPVAVDERVLGFAFMLTVLTGVAFGIAPALRASRDGSLGVGSRTSGGSRAETRLRTLVHAFQLALAVMLLVGAAVLGRSFLRLTSTNLGFEPDNLLLVSYGLPRFRYPEEAQRTAFNHWLDQRLRALPGIEAVSWSSDAMIGTSGIHFVQGYETDTSGWQAAEKEEIIPFGSLDSAYFRVMRIPLLEGRAFTAADVRENADAVIIDIDMARRLWPGQRAVGRRFRTDQDGSWRTVVGVSGDVKLIAPHDPYGPFVMFYPTSRNQMKSGGDIILRARGNPAALSTTVRDVLRSLDSELPVNIRTASELAAESVQVARFLLVVMIVFAGIALLLAAIGIYGLVAFMVARRTREIGIRVAVGARRGQVVRSVFAHGFVISAAGLALGLAGAAALTRFLQSLLFQTSPLDPIALFIVTATLAFTSSAALLIPALRAARVDPSVALRGD